MAVSKKNWRKIGRLTPKQQLDFDKLSNYRQSQVAKMTPQQIKQYLKLNNRFNLSVNEYKQLYRDSRKARAKASRLNKEGQTIKIPKQSITFNWLHSREEFKKSQKRLENFLKSDYKKKINESQRQQLYQNLRNFYGNNAEEIIGEFDQMTEHEIMQFFEDNDDIDRILYDSDSDILDIVDMTKQKFISRLENFANYN